MINTRGTIFKTLKKRIRELTKHANQSPKEFKKILLAVILNDLKEWSEYIPQDDPNAIVNLLETLLMNNCFILDRFPENNCSYTNVNTPQHNNTWSRVWDKLDGKGIISISEENKTSERPESWIPDSTCETKIVYFVPLDKEGNTIGNKAYLENEYGKYGNKLKTVCDKMNVFINRDTNEAYYLDTNCDWKKIGSTTVGGMDQEEIENLLSTYRVNPTWHNDDTIELTLTKDSNARVNLLTLSEVEEMV